MNDSIFTKMMMSLQESKAENVKANLKALKENKEMKNEEVEIEVADKDIEAPLNEIETVEEPTEEDNEEVTESVSQDSQIKTTNKGTEVKELDGIKPATGADGIPDESVNKKKLDEDVAVSTDGDITIKDGGRLIEISDEDEAEADICPECGEVECECEPEAEEAEPAETEETPEVEDEDEEDLEVIDEPEEEEEAEEDDLMLDESTFNPFLTKFARDNYSNAKAVVVESARMNKERLVLECKTIFNSGKTSKFNLSLRGIIKEGRVCRLRANDNGYFKAESTRNPFTFRVSFKDNTLKCEGLEYNFKTKLAEGKMKEIKGKLIRG